jgi:hypothetical protein
MRRFAVCSLTAEPAPSAGIDVSVQINGLSMLCASSVENDWLSDTVWKCVWRVEDEVNVVGLQLNKGRVGC